MKIPAKLRAEVIRRAHERCEKARVRLRRIRNQANKRRFSILATGSGPIIFGGLA